MIPKILITGWNKMIQFKEENQVFFWFTQVAVFKGS